MLFKRLRAGTYTSHGRKRPSNGDITKLQWADNLAAEETILVGLLTKSCTEWLAAKPCVHALGMLCWEAESSTEEGVSHTFAQPLAFRFNSSASQSTQDGHQSAGRYLCGHIAQDTGLLGQSKVDFTCRS